MLRALIAATLLTGAAAYIGAPIDTFAGYAFAGCLAVWLLLPVYRTGRRITRRYRGRRATGRVQHPATSTPPAATVTQINHYYYNCPPPAPAPGRVIDPDQLGLPQYSAQKLAHDEIFRK